MSGVYNPYTRVDGSPQDQNTSAATLKEHLIDGMSAVPTVSRRMRYIDESGVSDAHLKLDTRPTRVRRARDTTKRARRPASLGGLKAGAGDMKYVGDEYHSTHG